MKSTVIQHTQIVKQIADELGFMSCGISQAGFLEDEAPRLEQWLSDKRNGKMGYMENHFDKRLDPTILVPGAKSVVSLLFNYYTPTVQLDTSAPKISKYALGTDYHFVVKDKLKDFMKRIAELIGEVDGRVFVDSAPVLDKAWAAKSGLGWIGKHTNLISKKRGSYFFIAELILDLELTPDSPTTDHCGTCTKCIDACPTDAIVKPYEVDGSKCISYFTIELRDELLPATTKGQFDNWMFGCDICQDVCPWNRFSFKHNEPQFEPSTEMIEMSKEEWQDLTKETFNRLFKHSPIKRTGYKGLIRNIKHLNND